MHADDAIVYILDDEPAMLRALSRLLRAEGFEARTFTAMEDFLQARRPGEISCLILDVGMPALDGMEVQQRLQQTGISIPIIFLTGRGSIPLSVRAIKSGAVDFLTKPVNDTDLLRAVQAALEVSRAEQRRTAGKQEALARHANLTPRERQVMHHVVAGLLNKQIAAELGTGEQNIKMHRARVMQKMGVESVPDLVRASELVTGRAG
jgi:FixJ family two-component response regulator